MHHVRVMGHSSARFARPLSAKSRHQRCSLSKRHLAKKRIEYRIAWWAACSVNGLIRFGSLADIEIVISVASSLVRQLERRLARGYRVSGRSLILQPAM